MGEDCQIWHLCQGVTLPTQPQNPTIVLICNITGALWGGGHCTPVLLPLTASWFKMDPMTHLSPPAVPFHWLHRLFLINWPGSLLPPQSQQLPLTAHRNCVCFYNLHTIPFGVSLCNLGSGETSQMLSFRHIIKRDKALYITLHSSFITPAYALGFKIVILLVLLQLLQL